MRTEEQVKSYLATCKEEKESLIKRAETLEDEGTPERDLLWNMVLSVENSIQTLTWMLEG